MLVLYNQALLPFFHPYRFGVFFATQNFLGYFFGLSRLLKSYIPLWANKTN